MAPEDTLGNASAIDPLCGLLRRLEQKKQDALARDAMCDPSTISRFATGKGGLTASQLARLLNAVQLKLVAADRVLVRREELELLRRVYALAVERAPEILEVADS